MKEGTKEDDMEAGESQAGIVGELMRVCARLRGVTAYFKSV